MKNHTRKNHTRREFLINGTKATAGVGFTMATASAGLTIAAAGSGLLTGCSAAPRPLDGIRIGVIDINDNYGGLARTAQIEAIEKAARIGFEGVEVTFGGPDEEGMLLLARPQRQQRYLEEFDRHGIVAAGTHIFALHQHLLKDPNDPVARNLVEQAIPATAALGTKVILLPFFGPGALETQRERDYVADLTGELGQEADRYGVILGLENSLSAEANLGILERAGSPAVKVYYDVGNSQYFGHDIYREIRLLGSENICQFHLKDNPHYMGEGEIDFPEVMRAIDDIGYRGWVIIETLSPSGDRADDLRRNLEYLRGVIDGIREERS